MYLLLIVFIAFEISTARNVPSTADEGELILVHGIYRHGDRTPIRTYPTDPYRNASYWPEGWGQLTNLGKQQQYELGKYLRTRYDGFLPDKYSADDVIVNSTDVDRTLMSAQVNLAGLYQFTDANWNQEIKWQPIPIHTIPEYMDHVVATKKFCRKHDVLTRNLKNSDYFKSYNTQHQDLYQYITENSGTTVREVTDVVDIQDVLYIQDLKGMSLPKWCERVYPQPLLSFVELWLEIPCFTTEQARLKAGPLIKTILKHIDDKIEGTLKQKMWIYSAHDTTLSCLLKSLKVLEPHVPPYCATTLLELRKKNGEFYVEVFYRNSTAVEPYLLQIPGCEPSCLLKDFKRLTENLIPGNWEEECKASS